jgi:hypothetical protein
VGDASVLTIPDEHPLPILPPLSSPFVGSRVLGACRTWGIESEKAAERGQIVTISPAHSGAMVQESGEIWTA